MKNAMIKKLCKKVTAAVLAGVLLLSATGLSGESGQKVQASGTTEATPDTTKMHTEAFEISEYRKDGKNTAPRPVESAYADWIFAGWYEDPECTESVARTAIDGSKTAKFVPAELLSVKCQTQKDTDSYSPNSKLRIVSTVDNLNYSRVGFELQMKKADGTTKTAIYDTKSVCKKVAETADGVSFQYMPEDFHPMAGYFTTVTATGISNANFSKGFYIRPYWETLDGTLVYGVSRYARVEDSYLGIVNVPVRMYSGEAIAKGSLKVSYDSNLYEYYPNQDGSYDLANNFFEQMTVTPGEGVLTCAGSTAGDNVIADGMYVNLRFRVKNSAFVPEAGSVFTVTETVFQDKDNNNQTVRVADGFYKKINSSMIPVIGNAGKYYTDHDYLGTIESPNANEIGNTDEIRLTEKDKAVLKESGFGGGSQTANRITIDMDTLKAGNAARSVGILFQNMQNEDRMKAYVSDEGIQQNYYISVWVRFSEASEVGNTCAVVVGTENAKWKQANGQWPATEESLKNLKFMKNQWTELQIPLSEVKKAYAAGENWTDKMFGLWFDWLMYPDVAGGVYPAGTKLTIDISEAEIKKIGLPSVPNLNPGRAGSYFASNTYQGAIDSAYASVGETEQYTLTDTEYAGLPAGAATGDHTANRITINMNDKQGGNAARSVGILFPDTLNGQLKAFAQDRDVQENCYVSVWLRFSETSKVGNTYAIVTDRAKKMQAFSPLSFPTFEKATWTELRIPMSSVKAGYDNFAAWGNCQGAEEDVFGIWLDWLLNPMAAEGDAYPDETVLTIDIYGAELKYEGLTVDKEGTAVDLTVPTDILGEGTETAYEIYRDGKRLTAGTEYAEKENQVVFYTSGDYIVKYRLTNPRYTGTLCINRNVKVSYKIGKAGAYFASNTYQGAIDSAYASVGETEQYTLTDTEYAGLPAGAATGDHTANRITINMNDKQGGNAARSVGILFPDTLNGQLKAFAQDRDVQENCYVSVWLRFSETSNVGNTYAMVADRTKAIQAVAFPAMSFPGFEKETWTELRIPMSYVKTAYDNFTNWGCYDKGAEEDVFGIWFDWLMYPSVVGGAYPDGTVLTIDIYSAQIVENQ